METFNIQFLVQFMLKIERKEIDGYKKTFILKLLHTLLNFYVDMK